MGKISKRILAVSIAMMGTFAATGIGTSSAAAASGNVITLRFATWDTVGHQALVNLFEKTHPNIKVKWEHVNGNFDTKIITELAAGDAPDVWEVDNPAMYAMKGALENLSQYSKNDPSFHESAYYPGVLAQGIYNGQLWTLPKDYSDFVVFFNKKLFEKAHIPFPKPGWTWQQLYQDAQKLTVHKNGKTVQWGALMPTDWDFQFDSLVQAFGGNVTNPSGRTTVGYLNSPTSVKTMKFLLNFYEQHLTPSLQTVNSLQNVDFFASQKAAMSITGTWFVSNWNKTPGLQYGAVGMPKGTQQANFVVSAGFGMNPHSANKQAAWEFLKFVGGYQGSMKYGYYALPSMPKAAKDLHMTQNPIFSLFLNQLKNVRVLPVTQNPFWGNTGGTSMTNMLDLLENKARSDANIPTSFIQSEMTKTAKTIQQQIVQAYANQ